MILKVFIFIFKLITTAIAAILTPFVNLFPTSGVSLILDLVVTLENIVGKGMSLFAYMIGPQAVTLFTLAVAVRVTYYMIIPTMEVIRMIPMVGDSIKRTK